MSDATDFENFEVNFLFFRQFTEAQQKMAAAAAASHQAAALAASGQQANTVSAEAIQQYLVNNRWAALPAAANGYYHPVTAAAGTHFYPQTIVAQTGISANGATQYWAPSSQSPPGAGQ